jgi:signal transduction histidine kinase
MSQPSPWVKKSNASQTFDALRDQCAVLQRQVEQLHALQEVSQELVLELDHDRLLHNILRSAVDVVDASAGSLLLLDETTDELVFKVVEGGGGEKLQGTRMSRYHGIAGWVLKNGEAVIVDDTLQDQRFYAEIGNKVDYTTTSMLSVPMLDRGEAIGVLQILNKRSGERFDESDKELLTAFAAQSAIAIRNAQLYRELREERDRLVAVEEDVRKNLARNLHDGPTQIVAAIMMNLEFIRVLLQRAPDKVDDELDELTKLADRAMRQLRTMLFDLRPIILEAKGLIPALEAYAEKLTGTESFAVYLIANGEVPRLNKQAESAIFAVVQEAINNAKKHAHADHIQIAVRCSDDTLDVCVRDDGAGFDVSAVTGNYESRGSLGVLNMYERAEMIGGTFSMDSAVGEGTTVRLVAPLAPNLSEGAS